MANKRCPQNTENEQNTDTCEKHWKCKQI